MKGSWARRILRPRGLVLTVLLVVVAALLWRGAKAQRAADASAAAAWLLEGVRAAQEDRDATPSLGATEPVVASAFATWVRSALPPGEAGDARIDVTVLGSGPFGGGDGDATHRAVLRLRGARAEADLLWSASAPAVVAFRSAGSPG